MNTKQKILDSIQILVKQNIKKAGYDKTIQAKILSCEDQTIGKYRCRYQDAVFYAYASNPDMSFSIGADVYVLVPNNDMRKEKTIIGTIQNLGIDYRSQAQGEEKYKKIGTNVITSNDIYYLNTENSDYSYRIYENGAKQNDLKIDITSLEHYLRDSNSIIVAGKFKTDIPSNRQSLGHYGLRFGLLFKNSETGEEESATRDLIFNQNDMVGQPYLLTVGNRQFKAFDNIDGENFIRIEYIDIYNNDFPNSLVPGVTGVKLTEGDIEISDLEFWGAIRLTDEQLNGVYIRTLTPQGNYFSKDAAATAQVSIVVEVYERGNKIPDSELKFYWGREDVRVNPGKTDSYEEHLQSGWKCLNEKDSQLSEENERTIWKSGSNTYVVSKNAATARKNRFKIAVVYSGSTLSEIVTITNQDDSVLDVEISSDRGTQFYYSQGNTTLTCDLKGKEAISEERKFQYYWSCNYSNDTRVYSDDQKEQENYNLILQNLTELEQKEKKGTLTSDQASTLENVRKDFQLYTTVVPWVYENCFHNFSIFPEMRPSGQVRCSVFEILKNNDEVFIGTGSIALYNSYTNDGRWYVTIENGSQVFQYNEYGVAPNNGSFERPQILQALSFSVYDNLENKITAEQIWKNPDNEITWKIPKERTMIEIPNLDDYLTPDQDTPDNFEAVVDQTKDEYVYIKKAKNIAFNIKQKYDIKCQNNQIQLIVKYQDIVMTARTSFSFVKEGEIGTNGTQYVVRIVPNTQMANPPLYPMILQKGDSIYQVNYGIGSPNPITNISLDSAYPFFKVQLWKSGQKVFEGISLNDGQTYTSEDGETQIKNIIWEPLYNFFKSDPSTSRTDTPLFLKQRNGQFSPSNNRVADGRFYFNAEKSVRFIPFYATWVDNKEDLRSILKAVPYDEGYTGGRISKSTLIKCSVTLSDDKTYYGVIPVITGWVSNPDQKIYLKDYTGFTNVLYSNSGGMPQYDNSTPFQFVYEQKKTEEVVCAPYVSGYQYIGDSIFNPHFQNANLLTIVENYQRKNLKDNQWDFKPASSYNGFCLTNSVGCQFKKGEGESAQIVAQIDVPIHFLLNRYTYSHLNEWDGNSIQIKEAEGYILSPQMGAGTKEADNSFTGVLMGEVRDPTKKQADIGLMAYNKGQRTFFLNSLNGSTILGKYGPGQIILDPTSEKQRGFIFSSNFWKNYDDFGLPSSYDKKNYNIIKFKDLSKEQQKKYYEIGAEGLLVPPQDNREIGQGMLIDLTTPQIRFGNEDAFKANNQGAFSNRGVFGGWQMQKNFLYSQRYLDVQEAGLKYLSENKNKSGYKWNEERQQLRNEQDYRVYPTSTQANYSGLTIYGGGKDDSQNGYEPYIEYGLHNHFKSTEPGFYLGPSGLSINNQISISKDGNTKLSDLFQISNGLGDFQFITLGSNLIDSEDNYTRGRLVINQDGITAYNLKGINSNGLVINAKYRDQYGNFTVSANNFYINDDGSVGGKSFVATDGNVYGNVVYSGKDLNGEWKACLTQHQSLKDYALKTDIPTVPAAFSATNQNGYITNSMLNQYVKKSYSDSSPTETTNIRIATTKNIGGGLYIGESTNSVPVVVLRNRVTKYKNDFWRQECYLGVSNEDSSVYLTRLGIYENITNHPLRSGLQIRHDSVDECTVSFVLDSTNEDEKTKIWASAAAPQWHQPSDKRIKKDISYDLELALKSFENLRPASFSFKGENTKTTFGFIAQDVQEVFSEEEYQIVHKGMEEDGFLTLNYQSLFTLGMAKIQQQQKQIDSLTERIEKLEQLILNE